MTAARRLRRLTRIALFILLPLALLCLLGEHLAARALKAQIERALGPESTVAAVRLGFSQVEIEDLRVRAPAGWPAPETLRAARVVVRPQLRSLLSETPRIAQISIEHAYLSMLRAPGGGVRLLPSLLEHPSAPPTEADASQPKGGGTGVRISRIDLEDGTLEFFDATVRRPPHLLRLEHIEARLESLRLPALDTRSQLSIRGVLQGVHQNGKLAIHGWSVFGTRDADLTTTLRDVDLISLQPYLIKASETGVKRGSADLDLHSSVKDQHLHAPGQLTLRGLELSTGGAFMGVPRQLVVHAMQDREQKISLKFVLEGRLDDPHFSLNENLTTRLTSSLAEHLGVSVGGVVRNLGDLGGKGLGGIGRAIGKLFGK